MASLIIPASKSITITNKFPNENINTDRIKIGYDQSFKYISYLDFDISSIPTNIKILSAELTLFKTNNFYEDYYKRFVICQLENYFSSYTSYNNQPNINTYIKKVFHPITKDVSITINIKKFLLLWTEAKRICTGFMLASEPNCNISEFGSSNSHDNYIIPFIKLTFEKRIEEYSKFYFSNNCNCTCTCTCNCDNRGKPSISEVNVTGTVASNSKYAAIVDVEVKRPNINKIDTYYVTDEYDNTNGNQPLHVNKTYKIAIVPKEGPNDSETVNFYGSYKE